MKRGLVIGKFYPPHRGHHFLINTAARQVDCLDVLLCWKQDQEIPGEVRARWLTEIHKRQANVHVRTVWDFGDDDNSEAWARRTKDVLGYAPDVVFTSEDYGARFAELLGAEHVLIDRNRKAFSISGTAIRADPLEHWNFLESPVRAWYALRVAIVGAESTGTTTLARALAQHYQTDWVPEYGREYCEQLVRAGELLETHQWRTEEVVHIAKTQLAREEEAVGNCNRVLFCDTDALATSIWHERYVGHAEPDVRSLANPDRYVLYVLTDADVPFVQDGLRDGEGVRNWMTERFKQELETAGVPWILVQGNHEYRMQSATAEIDKFLDFPRSSK